MIRNNSDGTTDFQYEPGDIPEGVDVDAKFLNCTFVQSEGGGHEWVDSDGYHRRPDGRPFDTLAQAAVAAFKAHKNPTGEKK